MFIMILMGCRSSHAAESTCVCNDEPRPVCVPPGADVDVPCPKVTADDVTFNLFVGDEMMNNHSRIHGVECISSTGRVLCELHTNNENKSASFRLLKVNASSQGIYRCEGTIMYPPPLKYVHSDKVLVQVQGYQCEKACTNITIVAEPQCGFHWMLVSGVTSLYSVTVTIVAIILWVKLRKTDSQSDYMNTKPRATRDRKKNRQKPFVQRHF